jgi:glucose-6-phosphate 1-dehydrogenase
LEAWRIVDPVLRAAEPTFTYEPKSWGPVEAQRILSGDDDWAEPSEG